MLWHEARSEPAIAGFICGCEYAPTTRRPHLQGYLELVGKKSLQQLLALPLFSREIAQHHSLRLSVARGTVDHNRSYIFGPYTTADGTEKECDQFPISFGKFSKGRAGQGRRTDWANIHELVKAQATDRELMEAEPHLGYAHSNKLASWRNIWKDVPLKREWHTRAVICFGPPGAGKTHWIDSHAKAEAAKYGQVPYEKGDNSLWWPDYHGDQVIIINEMAGNYFPWNQLLKVLDSGQFHLQYKGGNTPLVARTIYMSCNDHPSTWYKTEGVDGAPKTPRAWDDTNAFRRRIKDYGELFIFTARLPRDTELTPLEQLRVSGADAQYVYFTPERDLALLPLVEALPVHTGHQEFGTNINRVGTARYKEPKAPGSQFKSSAKRAKLADAMKAFTAALHSTLE